MSNGTKLFMGIAIVAIGLISTLGSARAYVASRDAGAGPASAWDAASAPNAWDAAAVVGYEASAALGHDAGAAPIPATGGMDAGSVTLH